MKLRTSSQQVFASLAAGAIGLLAIGTIYPAAGHAAELPKLPPHPRLLFDQSGIEQFRRKVEREPWRLSDCGDGWNVRAGRS
ncbi:MAG: hypothetical protein ACOY3P_26485 [Planctomycetota bacterium]